jgi:hypothetical protein
MPSGGDFRELEFADIGFRSEPFPNKSESIPWSIAMLGTILLIVLILLLVGALPSWSHSRSWGYGPSGGLGLVLIIVIVLLVTGRI